MIKQITLGLLIFILVGCSMMPRSAKSFENYTGASVGKNIHAKDMWGIGINEKIIVKDNTKEWYLSLGIGNDGVVCKYIYITDLEDVIIGYKILTKDTCKYGFPSVF